MAGESTTKAMRDAAYLRHERRKKIRDLLLQAKASLDYARARQQPVDNDLCDAAQNLLSAVELLWEDTKP